MERYEIIERETVWKGRFLRCLRLTYRDVQGVARQWEAVERVNCDGIVGIVPVTDDGHILLIRQFRPPMNGCVVEFPAGLNDKGERLEDAARRELIEETGYEAKEMILLAKGPLSSGLSNEVLTVFLAKGLRFRGIDGRDETEDIEVLKIPLDRVYEELSELSKGSFIDLKVFGFIEIAKRHMTS